MRKTNYSAAQLCQQVRVSNGWSRTRLAEALEVCPTTVSNWENGIHTPIRSLESRLLSLQCSDRPRDIVFNVPITKVKVSVKRGLK